MDTLSQRRPNLRQRTTRTNGTAHALRDYAASRTARRWPNCGITKHVKNLITKNAQYMFIVCRSRQNTEFMV
ncbi:hypothetical protein EVAR_38677_1 [Eumeta japonica]|uniref:Uncharacterized protein n=1 Tax=Eumeta variegata TaxID=151549 RepID=A0A4C1YBX0_EUMVA|nr:hypothetical protein EVAR_38677_1 [Eumeta japonica]